MRSPYDMNGYMPPRKVEFETFEEFEQARDQIEALLLENHKTMKRAEYLTDQLEAKRADIEAWQSSLDAEQDRFVQEKEEFEHVQHSVLELQGKIQLAIERINAANRDPIESINEALLLLELEENPETIAKLLRDKREELDVKW